MRTNAYIQALWDQGGPFIGPDGRPHGRVTVQLPWPDLDGAHTYDILRTNSDSHAGIYAQTQTLGHYNPSPADAPAPVGGSPLRWFQKSDDSQPTQELPNISTISIDAGVDQDSATCTVSMYNQQMDRNGQAIAGRHELGQPGYFNPTRGESIDSQGRWTQVTNVWENMLVPDAIIRTFQGYGGTSKSIAQAVVDGNIMLTGVWLIDTVTIRTDGMIEFKCRDMMKLLIDQQLYPPLVPNERYPLKYFRWRSYTDGIMAAARQGQVVTPGAPTGDRAISYSDSSGDHWYGYNYSLHGHTPTDVLDGDPNTFWLGVGNIAPDRDFAYDWVEVNVGSAINAVYINPFQGNYLMYISVMENGVWQGADTIPYSAAALFATGNAPYGATDTGAAIPYVMATGVPWEIAQDYILPRLYQADKVRVTFHEEQWTEWPQFHYRAGVREIGVKVSASGPSSGGVQNVTYNPLFLGADTAWDRVGYGTTDGFNDIDAFGDARKFDYTGGSAFDAAANNSAQMRYTPSGNGYYVVTQHGKIYCYGAAPFYGDPSSNDSYVNSNGTYGSIVDMAVTHTGLGYWVLDSFGYLFAYGDATDYGDFALLGSPGSSDMYTSLEAHSSAMGLWALQANGTVLVRGSSTNFGNWTPTPTLTPGVLNGICLRRTATNAGYWLMADGGQIEAKGDAVFHGSAPDAVATQPNWYLKYLKILPQIDGGYNIMRGDGTIVPLETSYTFGSPLPGGVAVLRTDGNYKDYTDIIKDLILWSGFLLYDDTTLETDFPPIYGNLESTGAYAPEDLPDEIFDKKPVIDAINQIKEVVGYHVWCDEEGAFHFESPNWWGPGNFNEDGVHLDVIPEIDEMKQLTSYGVTMGDEALRSLIIISSEVPDQAQDSTIVSRLIPSTAKQLRGLVKPAMWINGWFQNPDEQKLMAELIAMQIHFQCRLGQVSAPANPCIQINDQVRIFERQTSETYIHYVRGKSTSMNLETGEYTMTLTTNWLGDRNGWAVQEQGDGLVVSSGSTPPSNIFFITPIVKTWLDNVDSAATSAFSPSFSDVPTGGVAP